MAPRKPEEFEKIRLKTDEKIRHAALQEFSCKGFFNTSIRDIAKAANISTGLLYNYYKNKEDLALAVLNTAFEKIDHAISSDDSNAPLNQAISNFIELLIQQNDKIRLLAQMGIQKEKFEFLNEQTHQKYLLSVKQFENHLTALKYPNPALEAKLLVATLDGIAFESLLMGEKIDLQELKIQLIKKYTSDEN